MGIETLDTAISYGDSIERLGSVGVQKFKIITKIPRIPFDVKKPSDWYELSVTNLIKKLNKNNLEAILLHYPKDLLINKNHKLIYLTTNSGYGIGEKDKFCDENSPLKPISLYGKTKCDAEDEVKKLKNAVSFRLATVFGASYRMRSDLLVNNFVQRAVKTNCIDVFEPNFRRNFIHIKDVVKGIVFAINNFNKIKSFYRLSKRITVTD